MTNRRAHALELLSRTGIWPSNYAPPALHMMWRLGFDLPPPHLNRFARNALFTGSFFGVAWGLIMWFVLWMPTGMPGWVALAAALAAGLLFGLSMAAYYDYGRRKHGLPYWDEIKTED